jgi:hypothetical protein
MTAKVERSRIKPGGAETLSARQNWYPKNSFYKPVSINVQGKVYCPVGCMGCGIDAKQKICEAASLPIDSRLRILEEAYDAGLISYLGCIGNAEPFTSLEFLGEVLERFRGRLDNEKINTSCITFTNTDTAVKQLMYLRDKGWTSTTFVVPALSLSIGMQQEAGVPIDRVVNGIVAFHQVFTPGEAWLYVSHYHTVTRYRDSVAKLEEAYRQRTGRNLHDNAIVKTYEIIDAGRAGNFAADEFAQFQLRDKVSGRRCFELDTAEYADPVMVVDELGNIWMCPCFGPHEGTLLGNISDKTIKQAIIEANANDFFRLISTKGTKGVYKIAKKYEPGIGTAIVTNRHAACAKLYSALANHPKFKEELRQRLTSE